MYLVDNREASGMAVWLLERFRCRFGFFDSRQLGDELIIDYYAISWYHETNAKREIQIR